MIAICHFLALGCPVPRLLGQAAQSERKSTVQPNTTDSHTQQNVLTQ